MNNFTDLQIHLRGMGRTLLGYSGGVDSAVLAVAATRTLGPERFLAVIGRSASYPRVQYDTAMAIAREFSVPLREVDTHEMDDPDYVANPTNRCYFCKRELWGRLTDIARRERFDTIMDGTNADDLGEHRPGLAAAAEWSVASPFAELGWTKAMIRSAARSLGLPVWDAPAAPCLSSRVAHGLSITPERLRRVEQGEEWLRGFGITGDLRVRLHASRARLEVTQEAIPRLQAAWSEVESAFNALGFTSVELDPRGYRRGSMFKAAAEG